LASHTEGKTKAEVVSVNGAEGAVENCGPKDGATDSRQGKNSVMRSLLICIPHKIP
jgi:hypothetical protein